MSSYWIQFFHIADQRALLVDGLLDFNPVILTAFLIASVLVLIGIVVAAVRGLALWREGKRIGGAFTSELALFEERSARTEQLLADADRASQDLRAATERLRISRAARGAARIARDRPARTRWLRAFLPAR